ncbi:hypothetical protein [Chryseobacterium jejuense]|uniref:Uncharacterized protein n=1 Tax=Chryseobacterium jejuense TaxID=445960 RepID=A0A2X2XGH3_CHRJE|nr:hypothetical protein [Chryseobacterium jejuense]SDI59858.1 hypothetical protein SAMN05421542_1433 [Chryseobacterium jejuense]SQB47165.1 Uncharacterised protein [Chryseobacterium jejuense]
MLLLVFISIAIIYYLIQKQKITRIEKREDFKARQEEKLQDILKKAKEEDLKNKENNNL